MLENPFAFRFDRRWRFPVPPEELWARLEETHRYQEWWRWLRSFDPPQQPKDGEMATCIVQGPGPFRLVFAVIIERLEPLESVATRVSGDLCGPARLEIIAVPGGSEAHLEWEVEVKAPFLRAATHVARPLMKWGQDWMVEQGVRSFRRHALSG